MKISILITEDKECIRSHIQEELNDLGYDTDVATSGKECLDKIKNKTPDILILDVMMEGISGIEVLRKLKNKVKNIYIIANTIVLRDNLESQIFEMGVDAYVEKPALFSELLAEIEKGAELIKKKKV